MDSVEDAAVGFSEIVIEDAVDKLNVEAAEELCSEVIVEDAPAAARPLVLQLCTA